MNFLLSSAHVHPGAPRVRGTSAAGLWRRHEPRTTLALPLPGALGRPCTCSRYGEPAVGGRRRPERGRHVRARHFTRGRRSCRAAGPGAARWRRPCVLANPRQVRGGLPTELVSRPARCIPRPGPAGGASLPRADISARQGGRDRAGQVPSTAPPRPVTCARLCCPFSLRESTSR